MAAQVLYESLTTSLRGDQDSKDDTYQRCTSAGGVTRHRQNLDNLSLPGQLEGDRCFFGQSLDIHTKTIELETVPQEVTGLSNLQTEPEHHKLEIHSTTQSFDDPHTVAESAVTGIDPLSSTSLDSDSCFTEVALEGDDTTTEDAERPSTSAGLQGTRGAHPKPSQTAEPPVQLTQENDAPTTRNTTRITRTRSCHKSFGYILLYLVSAAVFYPLFLALLPLLCLMKVLVLLCLCIPCKMANRILPGGKNPVFFTSKRHGSSYYTIIIFKETIPYQFLYSYLLSRIKQAYCQADTKPFVQKLASHPEHRGCFRWWAVGESLELGSRIHIVHRSMITSMDVSNFVSDLATHEAEPGFPEWSVFLVPNFSNHSAIIIQTHHTLATGTTLKNTLTKLFGSFKSEEAYAVPQTETLRSVLKAIAEGPYVSLRYLLRLPVNNCLHPSIISGRLRMIFSEPFDLQPARLLARNYSMPLTSIFLACLSSAVGKHLRQSKQTLLIRDIPFVVPVSMGAELSLYVVNLPVTEKSSWKQLRKVNAQVKSGGEEARILLTAAKFASLLMFPCIIDFMAASILRRSTGIFAVTECPKQPTYLDNYLVSSVASWPPLFNKAGIAVNVVCCRESFRVCVVTRRSVMDWPDVLMRHFLSAYSELIQEHFA